MGAYSNFDSFWQNLTEKILNLAIFRQEKCLKSPKLDICLVRLCQKVPIIYKICMAGAYSRWALIQARTVFDYRPISLLSNIEEIIEKFIYKSLNTFLEKKQMYL